MGHIAGNSCENSLDNCGISELFPLTMVRFPLFFLKDGSVKRFAQKQQLPSLQRFIDTLAEIEVGKKIIDFPTVKTVRVASLNDFAAAIDRDNQSIIKKLSDLADYELDARMFLLKTIAYLSTLKKVAEIDLRNYLFCSWCEKVYDAAGEVETTDIPYSIGDSHGICNLCKVEMGKEVSQRKKLKGFDNVKF